MVVPIAEFFTQWLAWLRVSKLKETDGRVLGERLEAYTRASLVAQKHALLRLFL